MSKPLKVQALKRYAKPAYPGAADPNPLEEVPQKPYPFSKAFLRWASAVGLLALANPLSGQVADTVPVFNENVFNFKSLGLPYTPVSFGTGLPERLKEKEVRKAVSNAMQLEGLNTDTNYVWRDGDQAFKLDYYDAANKVGYVFVDYSEYGADTRSQPIHRIQDRAGHYGEPVRYPTATEWLNNEYHTESPRSVEELRMGLDQQNQDNELVNALKAHYFSGNDSLSTSLPDSLRLLEDLKLFKALRYGHPNSSLNSLFNQYLEGSSSERSRTLERIYRLHLYGYLSMYRNGPEDLMSLAVELTDPLFPPDAPSEKFQWLTEARDLWWRTFGRDNEKFTKRLKRTITEARDGNWSSLIKLLAAQHETTADLEELKLMTTVEGPGDDRILVINPNGLGTITFGDPGRYRQAPDSLFQHLPPRDLMNEEAKKECRRISREWSDQEKRRRSEVHIKALENMVRGWIRWAKQEGRY